MGETRSTSGGDHSAAADDRTAPLMYAYRLLVLFGPVALLVTGTVVLVLTTFIRRSDSVLVALIGASVGLMVAGVFSPRLHGAVEVGLQGMKAEVAEFPAAVLLRVAGAKEAAERLIEEGAPDKEQRVNEEVGRVLMEAIREDASTPKVDDPRQVRVPAAMIRAARDQLLK